MKYMSLDQKGSVIAEYIWIDSVGNTRSKSRVSFSRTILQHAPLSLHLPRVFVSVFAIRCFLFASLAFFPIGGRETRCALLAGGGARARCD